MADLGEAVLWLRMGDEDRERYGGPEWAGFDVRAAYNWPSTKLEEYEAETGYPMYLVLMNLPQWASKAGRVALFVARREAGVTERWVDFDPQMLQVKRREEPPTDTANAAGAAAGSGRGKPGTRAASRKAAPAASRAGSPAAGSAKSSTKSAQS
jgi:hypothetical protein